MLILRNFHNARVDELYNMQGEYECKAETFPVYDTQSQSLR